MRLDKIKANPNNPRVIRDDKFDKLVKSLQGFPEMMYKRPIVVDETMTVLGGNMRLRALQHIYGKSGDIPDEWVTVAEGWTEEQKREFVIKDNAAFGEWDWDALANEWGTDDLSEWGLDIPEDTTKILPAEAVEDDFDETKDAVEAVCKKGDIWKLGNHRLMCGDSTDSGSVAMLMDGEKADITFSSPPYNMMSTGIATIFNSAKVNKSYNIKDGTYNEFSDNLSDDDYSDLLNKSLQNALDHSDDVMFNIGILASSKKSIVNMLHSFCDKFCDIIVWNKDNSMPLGLRSNRGMLSHRCELIFCFNHNGSRSFSHPQWDKSKFDGTMAINRIDTSNSSGNEFAKIHRATFPVEFASKVLRMFSENTVIDLFGGTGTTLIAAEQLNRRCYMIEIDPYYCDVIIARWEKLTGKKAERVREGMAV